MSFSIDARGELAPDSLKGTLSVKDLTYCDDKGLLELGDAEVSSGRSEGQPVLTLCSSMADAHVRGIFLPTLLPKAFRNVVFSVFPALSEQVEYVQEEQYFDFNIELKAIDSLLNRLVPGLSAGAGATFEGGFDSRTFDLHLARCCPISPMAPSRAIRSLYSSTKPWMYWPSVPAAIDSTLRTARTSRVSTSPVKPIRTK